VDVLDRNPDLVRLMAKAGFLSVLLGIETPSQEILDKTHKGTTIEQAERVVRNLRRHDIAVWGTFAIGFPGETRRDMLRTVDYARKLDIDIVQLTVVTPIPGSEIYEDLVARGEINNPNWDDFDFSAPTSPDQISKSEMDQVLQEGYVRAYCRPGYLLSFLGDRSRNINRLRTGILKVFWNWIRYAGLNSIRSRLGLKPVDEADYEAGKGWVGPTDVEEVT
jgi:radical SAM superfamily enzyme YgiQ (UPF0313 family)